MPARRRSAANSTPKTRRRWLRRTLWTMLTLGLLAGAGLAVAYALTPIPKPNDRALAQNSIIYFADGKSVLDRFASVNRQIVGLDRVPDHVQKAFLAAEDRNFYSNNGISPSGIARSVWVGLRGGPQQGGSTITQQYVKNYYLTQDRTLTRKAREILISIKIDGEVSKDQILADYLNTIYFGRGADGIQTASQAYFNKSVNALTVSEGALLAAVIRGPSLYDPGLGAEQGQLARGRWEYVLDGMVSEGWLSPQDRAELVFPEIRQISTRRGADGPRGFITEAVREELQSTLKLTDADLELGGLRIVTTVDKRAQEAAESAVAQGMPTGEGSEDLHVGLASVEPGDGAIRALYGGPDFGSGDSGFFNTATDAGLQAGSTYKVWTLLAALERGLPLTTRFAANSPMFFDEFVGSDANATAGQRQGEVVNFGNHPYGVVDMTRATALSANTYFAQLNIEVTPERTKDAAEKAGIRAAGAQESLGTNYANVFGTDLVTVLDQANAYATIAAEGKRATPYLIASVRGRGQFAVDYKAKPDVKQAFDTAVARDAIRAMSTVTQPGGTAAGASALGRPSAGKTGTTSDNYSAWFDGFTPGQLAAAVGIYKGDGSVKPENQMNAVPGVGELTGGTVPVRIWTSFMQGALEGQPVAPLPPAGNISGAVPSIATTAPTTSSTTTSSSTSTSTSTSSSTTTSTSSSATQTKPTNTATSPTLTPSPPPTSPSTSTTETSSSSSSPSPSGTGMSSTTSPSPGPTGRASRPTVPSRLPLRW